MSEANGDGLVILPAVPRKKKRLTENGEAKGQPALGEVTTAHTSTLLLDSEVV